ncbi:hypothetical protein MFLO_05610 [Listeria floridensis FSL S10-1187]|uniref:Uncharacterized protein n=1 Tax=Listeria floridensis FSL S10-1187 TaxID=1265817 RepID=A0ABN0RGR2_9LIST|nr:hypothetical protein MFLO_05610 [Listeria floridensis FSL S10-1187]
MCDIKGLIKSMKQTRKRREHDHDETVWSNLRKPIFELNEPMDMSKKLLREFWMIFNAKER